MTTPDLREQVLAWIEEAPDQTAGLDLLRQIVTPPPPAEVVGPNDDGDMTFAEANALADLELLMEDNGWAPVGEDVERLIAQVSEVLDARAAAAVPAEVAACPSCGRPWSEHRRHLMQHIPRHGCGKVRPSGPPPAVPQDHADGQWRSRWIDTAGGAVYGPGRATRDDTDAERHAPVAGARRAGSQFWLEAVGWVTDKTRDDYQ